MSRVLHLQTDALYTFLSPIPFRPTLRKCNTSMNTCNTCITAHILHVRSAGRTEIGRSLTNKPSNENSAISGLPNLSVCVIIISLYVFKYWLFCSCTNFKARHSEYNTHSWRQYAYHHYSRSGLRGNVFKMTFFAF